MGTQQSTIETPVVPQDVTGEDGIPHMHWSFDASSPNHSSAVFATKRCPHLPEDIEYDEDDGKTTDGNTTPHDIELRLWRACEISRSALEGWEFSESICSHLSSFYHGERLPCPHGSSCESFGRMDKNIGYRVDDRSHMLMYRHSARERGTKMPDDYNPMMYLPGFAFRSSFCVDKMYDITHIPCNEYWDQHIDLVLFLLIEVIDNGFGFDLILNRPTIPDEINAKKRQLRRFSRHIKRVLQTQGGLFANHKTLFKFLRTESIHYINKRLIEIFVVVEEKMKHERLLNIPKLGSNGERQRLNYGEVLALILYSGCNCNYDLCAVMRSLGNEFKKSKRCGKHKWSFFECCLTHAVNRLSKYDTMYDKSAPLYSGVSKVLLTAEVVSEINSSHVGGCFSSFVSASRDINVARAFRGKEGGLIFRIGSEMQSQVTCCDISWLSKFPDEEEVLFVSSYVKILKGIKGWRVKDIWKVEEENGVVNQFLELNIE